MSYEWLALNFINVIVVDNDTSKLNYDEQLEWNYIFVDDCQKQQKGGLKT
jgi:hypothetical protein